MKIEIVETKENPVMKRKEIRAVLHHEGKATPSRYDIVEDASKQLKTKKDNIIINKVFGIKGVGRSEVKISIYDKLEDIPKALLEKMKRRTKAPKAEEKPSEPPKEEPGEERQTEKPNEEKKEEPASEEKKEEGKKE